MRRVLTACALGALLVASVAVPAAAAPSMVPAGEPNVTAEFGAGEVCPFHLGIEGWSKEHVTEGEDADGNPRLVITGGAFNRITNLDTGAWVVRRSQGRGIITDRANVETLQFRGRSLLYFFPGEQSPAGTDGGLFLVTGRVEETLDLELNVITSFWTNGWAENLCHALD